jgi:hypothetical protein
MREVKITKIEYAIIWFLLITLSFLMVIVFGFIYAFQSSIQ